MRIVVLGTACLAMASFFMAADSLATKPATVIKADAEMAGFYKGGTLHDGGAFQVQTYYVVKVNR